MFVMLLRSLLVWMTVALMYSGGDYDSVKMKQCLCCCMLYVALRVIVVIMLLTLTHADVADVCEVVTVIQCVDVFGDVVVDEVTLMCVCCF